MNADKQFHVLMTLTKANLKSRYRNTVYGFLWVVLNPLLLYLAQVFAFSMLFHGNSNNYSVYLLGGLLPWLFITQSIDICTGIFLNSAYLLKNLPINPLALPFSQMLDNVINFLAAFLILILYFCIVGKLSVLVLAGLIVPVIFLFLMTTAFSTALAILNVRFRDLKFVVSFVFTVLYFLTPIFYSPHIIPENVRWILLKNPFYLMIRPFQELLTHGLTDHFYFSLISSGAVTLVTMCLSFVIWQKLKSSVSFYV